ncbi:MAG: hypothetical protein J6B98_02105 [Bacilli bacterium]|nr:hypothetical protein [Bacilli bacterium]
MEIIKNYEEKEGIIVAQHIFNYVYNQFHNDFPKDLRNKIKDTIDCISKYMDHDFQNLNCDIVEQAIYRRVVLKEDKNNTKLSQK